MITAIELSMQIAGSSDTANMDTKLTQSMPPCESHESVNAVINSLRTGGLAGVADLLRRMKKNDRRIKQGKNFPSNESKNDACEDGLLAADFSKFLQSNSGITRQCATVEEGTFRGPETTVFELAVTFYELMCRGYRSVAMQRVWALKEQEAVTLSPLMLAMLEEDEQS